MSGKLPSILIAVGIFSALFFTGCSPSANLNLVFSPDTSVSYKMTTEVIKDYRFEQPNLGKLKEEQTKTRIEMEFTQTIQNVDENGNATAQITIDQLKIDMVSKNTPELSFDSRNEKDQKSPMAKLLGKSYTIQIAPNGQVKTLDTKDVLAAVRSGSEKNIVKGLFKHSVVAERHGIPGMPESLETAFTVDDQWTKVVPPLPGMFAAKSYKKVYTLTTVENMVATVEMNAGESAEPAQGKSSMTNPFAKMFDTTDDFTGTLKIDLATGNVLKSEETLISTSVMEQMPDGGDPEKGPDALTMRFTHRHQLEKLD